MKKILLLFLLVSGLWFNVKSMYRFSVLTVRRISVNPVMPVYVIDDLLSANAEKWANLMFSADQACSFLFSVNRITVVMIKEVPSQS